MPKELIPTDPIIGPRNATQCLNVSEPCINDEECCEGICQFSPWPVYPPRKVCGPKPDTPPTAPPPTTPEQCLPEHQRCTFDQDCCEGLVCSAIHWLPHVCTYKKDMTPTEPTLPTAPFPTTPEQCLPEGEHCRIDQDCCEGMVCYTSPIKIYPPIKLCKYKDVIPTEPTLPTLPPPTTPEQCLTEGQMCRIDQDCCEGMICSAMGWGNLRNLKLCKKKDVIPTEPTLPTLPPPTTPKECLTVLKRCGDGQDCCEGLTCKETVLDWKPIAEKVCVPEQETTSAPLTTPGPDQCQKAGQRCEPGTPSQPSTLVCCPNHLCDLDSKVCRRVAYRQLDLDGKKAYRYFGGGGGAGGDYMGARKKK